MWGADHQEERSRDDSPRNCSTVRNPRYPTDGCAYGSGCVKLNGRHAFFKDPANKGTLDLNMLPLYLRPKPSNSAETAARPLKSGTLSVSGDAASDSLETATSDSIAHYEGHRSPVPPLGSHTSTYATSKPISGAGPHAVTRSAPASIFEHEYQGLEAQRLECQPLPVILESAATGMAVTVPQSPPAMLHLMVAAPAPAGGAAAAAQLPPVMSCPPAGSASAPVFQPPLAPQYTTTASPSAPVAQAPLPQLASQPPSARAPFPDPPPPLPLGKPYMPAAGPVIAAAAEPQPLPPAEADQEAPAVVGAPEQPPQAPAPHPWPRPVTPPLTPMPLVPTPDCQTLTVVPDPRAQTLIPLLPVAHLAHLPIVGGNRSGATGSGGPAPGGCTAALPAVLVLQPFGPTAAPWAAAPAESAQPWAKPQLQAQLQEKPQPAVAAPVAAGGVADAVSEGATSAAKAAAVALEACFQRQRSLDQAHKELRVRAVLALAMSQAWDECVQYYRRQRSEGETQQRQMEKPVSEAAAAIVAAAAGAPTRPQLLQFGWTPQGLDELYARLLPPYPPGRMTYGSAAMMYEAVGKGIALRGLRTRPGGGGGDVVLMPCGGGWGVERAGVMEALVAQLGPLEEKAQQEAEEAERERAARRQAQRAAEAAVATGGTGEVGLQAQRLPAAHMPPPPVGDLVIRTRQYLRLAMRPLLTCQNPQPLPLAEFLAGLRAIAQVTLDADTLSMLGCGSAEALLASFPDVVELRRGGGDDDVGLVPAELYRNAPANHGLHWRCNGGAGRAPAGLRPTPPPPQPLVLPTTQEQQEQQQQVKPVASAIATAAAAAAGSAAAECSRGTSGSGQQQAMAPIGSCPAAGAAAAGPQSCRSGPAEPHPQQPLPGSPSLRQQQQQPPHVVRHPHTPRLTPPTQDQRSPAQQQQLQRRQQRQRAAVAPVAGHKRTAQAALSAEPQPVPDPDLQPHPQLLPQPGGALPSSFKHGSDYAVEHISSTSHLTAPMKWGTDYAAGNTSSGCLSGVSCESSSGGAGCSGGMSTAGGGGGGSGECWLDCAAPVSAARYQELPAHLRPKNSAGRTAAAVQVARPASTLSPQQQQPVPLARSVGESTNAAGAAAALGGGGDGGLVPASREWQICGDMPVRIDQWALAPAEALGAGAALLAECRAARCGTAWQVTGYQDSKVLGSRWGATREAVVQALRQLVQEWCLKLNLGLT